MSPQENKLWGVISGEQESVGKFNSSANVIQKYLRKPRHKIS